MEAALFWVLVTWTSSGPSYSPATASFEGCNAFIEQVVEIPTEANLEVDFVAKCVPVFDLKGEVK
jgi:hypothetical protein